ncbi:NAD(P)/FAD-dependent oxidoreductase [soil metagenome]
MKIVVVGGGFGGVKAALELSNKPNMQVTLISQTENFEYHGALYRSGTGTSPLEVVIPLRNIFNRSTNVSVELDRIIGIDAKKKRVISETGNLYPYDKVIFAMGNILHYYGLPGIAENSMSLDTITNTIALRYQMTQLFKSTQENVTVAVIGAGPSGVELVGELQHFADRVASKYSLPSTKVHPMLVEGTARVLPTLSPQASVKALRRLKKLGVDVRLNTRINSCEPGKVCLDSGDLRSDLIVWTAGSQTPPFYAQYANVFVLERGKVKVDQFLRAVNQEHIYVIGDNAKTPFSGMAQTALHDAKFVAKNIFREYHDQAPSWYRAYQPIYAVPIGEKWAVLQTGKGVISGYRGWLVRRRADLAIYRNFEPYKQALKTYKKGNRLAKF